MNDWETVTPNRRSGDGWETIEPSSPSIGDRARRVAGLGIRAAGPVGAGAALGAGIGSVVPGVGTVLGGAAGATAAGLTQLADSALSTNMVPSILDRLGVPRPETKAERFAVNATGTMANMGGQIGMLGQLRAAPAAIPTAGEGVAAQLTQQPGRQLVGGATGAIAATEAADRGFGPTGQAVAGLVGGMVPFAPQMVRGRPTPEAQRTNEATVRGQQAGYSFPTSQSNPGFINSTLEGGIAGKAATERSASLKNQPVTNRIAKQDLGFPQERPLTVAGLAEYRQQQAQPYREIAAMSPQARQMLEDLQQTRADATAQFRFHARNADPATLREARALRQRAEGLETQFEQMAQQAGRPQLIDQLRQARVNIAKAHGYEAALDDVTGNVDARILASQFDKGAPMTGGSAEIARAANVYGPSMRLPENVGPNPGLSMFDYLTALGSVGGAVGTQNPAFMAGAALPLVRPAVRSGILSSPYQATMGRPNINPLGRDDALLLGILSGSAQQQR